ncbi:YhdH/YhfP family quinone oxidoreductase [Geoalkalibacter halelectricus]|uniref:YhdH/YhfP family quinone oxidoreductase n=1 Tax=Geoalkalibacter halelectricus TaxID=2847045 RepID=A0ABY5ZPL0_9BACT|nr:YhdH/YhfP family quinone oxidoreductase [Geoalkalibacter halelectricus]MDO3376880.1 YhdH/YhfP family quinone oxidoreductase [Geoalkalibacter halelectricus]UWZ81105.1 YhdH/YhfP family quinone oxidoreductase [Geoalkalibacter halelectricus]
MSDKTFKALIVEESEPKKFTRRIGERKISDLPAGDLLIRVHYSSLNYKDALSATGNKAVTRKFPHTPGIDAAGEVVECTCGRYQPGDQVLVTGYDLGMDTPGGFGEYIRIPCEWAVKLPDGLSLRESMIIGTAGFTAGLCVWKLDRAGVEPDAGDVLVTGASGGVGSIAVSILAKQGYRVVAVTGKPNAGDYLRNLGAAEVIGREAVLEGAERPMLKERWAGVVDVAGGDLLAAAIKATRYGGAVTCCGLVGSPDLNINVFPFILRGVSLLGVDSVQCPTQPRLAVWEKLAGLWKPEHLEETVTECGLEGLEEKIQQILKGAVRGRTLVRLLDA